MRPSLNYVIIQTEKPFATVEKYANLLADVIPYAIKTTLLVMQSIQTIMRSITYILPSGSLELLRK